MYSLLRFFAATKVVPHPQNGSNTVWPSTVTNEIKIADAWSWASENVERQVFTNESLKKIDEREEERLKVERKIRHNKEFKQIVENNNKKHYKKEE